MHRPHWFTKPAGFDVADARRRSWMRPPTTRRRPRFSTGVPRAARGIYGTPKHPMLDGLAAIPRAGSAFTRPQGGVFGSVELADGWSTPAVLKRAVAHGIRLMTGAVFFADISDDRARRLSISNRKLASGAEGLSGRTTAVAAAPVGAT